MKKYEVTICYPIAETVLIEAESREDAREKAEAAEYAQLALGYTISEESQAWIEKIESPIEVIAIIEVV